MRTTHLLLLELLECAPVSPGGPFDVPRSTIDALGVDPLVTGRDQALRSQRRICGPGRGSSGDVLARRLPSAPQPRRRQAPPAAMERKRLRTRAH